MDHVWKYIIQLVTNLQIIGSYLKIHYSGPDPCQDISQDFGQTRLPLPLIEMPLNLVTRSQNSVKQQCLEKIIYKLLTIFLSSVIYNVLCVLCNCKGLNSKLKDRPHFRNLLNLKDDRGTLSNWKSLNHPLLHCEVTKEG